MLFKRQHFTDLNLRTVKGKRLPVFSFKLNFMPERLRSNVNFKELHKVVLGEAERRERGRRQSVLQTIECFTNIYTELKA